MQKINKYGRYKKLKPPFLATTLILVGFLGITQTANVNAESSFINNANAQQNFDWIAVVFDNDIFVGNDNGYTNGVYVSLFDVGFKEKNNLPKQDLWVQPLMWTMPKTDLLRAVNAYMVGQAMNTPADITIKNPNAKTELPYSALLAFTNSYVTINESFADRASTTLGVVGPIALGNETQTTVHKIVGSDIPQGWNTQLQNELVFQFSRGRTWRTMVSDSGRYDLITHADLSLGTLQSSINTGVIFRYGLDLSRSYAITVFNNSRTLNPSAVNGGWFVYGGLQTGYVFNQIFTDGNTFRDSRRIDYKHEYLGWSTGLAYSGQNYAITIALNNNNVLQSGIEQKQLENLTEYGTISFAWRL